MKRICFCIMLVAFVVEAVFADQCWFLDSAQAKRLIEQIGKLKTGDVIIQYCEPCKTKPEKIIVYTIKNGLINRSCLDYAYIFFPQDQPTHGVRKYVNVASLIGCPTTGVSQSIMVDLSTVDESSSGNDFLFEDDDEH